MARALSVYAAIGARIVNLALDVAGAALEQRGEAALPARVRYACRHPRLPILYAACGNGDARGDERPYFLCALGWDEQGDLRPIADPVPLPARPMQVAVDDAGTQVLTCYSTAPGLTMHALNEGGRVGAEAPRIEPFDAGIATHQVLPLPSGTHGILVSRGMKGFATPGYVEGSLKTFRHDEGMLRGIASVTPPDTRATGGFNPRNIALHPTLPLAFVSLEGQHKLCVFRRRDGDFLDPAPLFVRDTLRAPGTVRERQDLGAVRLHPRGHVAYVANRNDGYVGGHQGPSWLNPDPIPVWPGGENNLAVFALDAETGAPTLIQHADTHGIHPRTFGLDPDGRLLVVGNYAPTRMVEEGRLADVPASLVLYRVADDGRLTLARRHPMEVGREKMWWTGVVAR